MWQPIQKDLGVMGAPVVEIAIKDASGSMQSTHKLCYMSPTRWRKPSCAGIPHNFPTQYCCLFHPWMIPRETCAPALDEAPQNPPPSPRDCLLAATQGDVDALREWSLNYYMYYGSMVFSMFNVCKYQPLPLEPLAQPILTLWQ